MATAPFDPRIRAVPIDERGTTYAGMTLGAREASLKYHVVKRVAIEGQWANGTTAADYVADLQAAVRHPSSRLGVYARRGGEVAVAVTDSNDAIPFTRIGPGALPFLLVVYSTDRDMIVTGYQFSAYSTISLPPEVLWLA